MPNVTALDSATNKGVDVKATNQALQVTLASLVSGELQSFNRLAGGPITRYSTWAGTTAVVAVTASPCIFYGLMIVSTGTGTINVWDGTTAQTTLMVAATPPTTGGTFWPAAGPGASAALGLQLNVGLSVQASSTGMVVYPCFAPST